LTKRTTAFLLLTLFSVLCNSVRADWPVPGNWPEELASDFGPRWSAYFHKGIDLAVPIHTPVRTVRNGYVRKDWGWENPDNTHQGYGFRIFIGNDMYAHLEPNTSCLTEEQLEGYAEVPAGQQIGWSGNTGRSTGPHLHFGIYPFTTNPLRIFTYSPGTPSIKSTELKGRVMKLNGKDCVLGEVNFIAYIETIKKDLNYVKFEVSPNPTGSGFPLEYDYEGTKRELDCKSTCDYNIPAQDYFYHSFNPLSSGNPWPEGEYKITVTAIDIWGHQHVKEHIFVVKTEPHPTGEIRDADGRLLVIDDGSVGVEPAEAIVIAKDEVDGLDRLELSGSALSSPIVIPIAAPTPLPSFSYIFTDLDVGDYKLSIYDIQNNVATLRFKVDPLKVWIKPTYGKHTFTTMSQGHSYDFTVTHNNWRKNVPLGIVVINPSSAFWWSYSYPLGLTVPKNDKGLFSIRVALGKPTSAPTSIEVDAKLTYKGKQKAYVETLTDYNGRPWRPPDESPLVSSPLELPERTLFFKPKASILIGGLSSWAHDLLNRTGDNHVIAGYDEKLSIAMGEEYETQTAKDFSILVIPSGGLEGYSNSSFFRVALAKYVEDGGTLVCFTQPTGRDFGALPGGVIGGFGYSEDISCHAASVGITSDHPIFSGQTKEAIDVMVDGYFTQWPSNATILLKRTRVNMPTLLYYPYGKGIVVASTIYSDFAFGQGQATRDEINLIRDLISWSKAPQKEIPRYKREVPGQAIAINIPVELKNFENAETNLCVITLRDPDKNLVETRVLEFTLEPEEDYPVVLFSTTISDTLGIWWVNYSLLDAEGNIVQEEMEGERFSVYTSLISTSTKEINFNISLPGEAFLEGTPITAQISLYNRSGIATYVHCKGNFGLDRPGVYVPAGETVSFTHTFTATMGQCRFDVNFYDEQGAYIGNANRAIYIFSPSVRVNVTTDKPRYKAGEQVNLSLTFTNEKPVTYSGDVSIRIVAPNGSEIFSSTFQNTFPANSTSLINQTATLPTEPLYGLFIVYIKVLSNGREIGLGATTFEEPAAILIISHLPPIVWNENSSNPVSFTINNIWYSDVTDGRIEVQMLDPDNAVIWSNIETFTLAQMQEKTLAYSVPVPQVKLGNYRLKTQLNYANKVQFAETIIPSSYAIQLSFDKPSYKGGENLGMTFTITNTGKFLASSTFRVQVPDIGFDQVQVFAIPPTQNQIVLYSPTIPGGILAGSHRIFANLTLANFNYNSWTFFVSSSKLELSIQNASFNKLCS